MGFQHQPSHGPSIDLSNWVLSILLNLVIPWRKLRQNFQSRTVGRYTAHRPLKRLKKNGPCPLVSDFSPGIERTQKQNKLSAVTVVLLSILTVAAKFPTVSGDSEVF